MARKPVELTESAKKKLPAALAAKERAKKAGSLGNMKASASKRQSALDKAAAAADVAMGTKRGKKK